MADAIIEIIGICKAAINKHLLWFEKQLDNHFEGKIIWLNLKDHQKYYSVGPTEFVYILRNAQMIVTDSFHGCMFSKSNSHSLGEMVTIMICSIE